MEKLGVIFPRYGKVFGDFSTLWKNIFHGVEKFWAGGLARVVCKGGRGSWGLLGADALADFGEDVGGVLVGGDEVFREGVAFDEV